MQEFAQLINTVEFIEIISIILLAINVFAFIAISIVAYYVLSRFPQSLKLIQQIWDIEQQVSRKRSFRNMLSSRDTINFVQEWHEAFGVPIKDKPEIPDSKRALLRIDLIKEELQELKEALHDDDLTEVFDAFLDLQYVLDGAMLEFGMHGIKREGFLEVHQSNMSKLGANGKPIKRGDGKILKGPNFQPPELEPIIEKEV